VTRIRPGPADFPGSPGQPRPPCNTPGPGLAGPAGPCRMPLSRSEPGSEAPSESEPLAASESDATRTDPTPGRLIRVGGPWPGAMRRCRPGASLAACSHSRARSRWRPRPPDSECHGRGGGRRLNHTSTRPGLLLHPGHCSTLHWHRDLRAPSAAAAAAAAAAAVRALPGLRVTARLGHATARSRPRERSARAPAAPASSLVTAA
jgi:hypothetical protein